MTKLEKKFEEWIKDHSGLIGSYKFVQYDYDSLKSAFLAGSEEKELREENIKLKNRNAELYGMYVHSRREADTYEQFLKAKEKEIAELKAQICKNKTTQDIGFTVQDNSVKKECLNCKKTFLAHSMAEQDFCELCYSIVCKAVFDKSNSNLTCQQLVEKLRNGI